MGVDNLCKEGEVVGKKWVPWGQFSGGQKGPKGLNWAQKVIVNSWELDDVMGPMILEGLGPFDNEMDPRGGEYDILPKGVDVWVKFS